MKNKPYPLYELPYIRDLKDMLEIKVRDVPDKTAFSFSAGRNGIVNKSYHDFYCDVQALGAWEYRNGLRERHIAIISENSYEWLIAFLSIVNGDNVAVPIDKELPKDEVCRLITQADVSVVFCSEAYKHLIEDADGITVYSMSDINQYITEGQMYIDDGYEVYRTHIIDRQRLCCIMFTSGTSGKSKGVMLSHENIAEDINGSCKLFVLEGNTMAVLPFHHAFGLVVGVLMVFHYGYENFICSGLKSVQRDLQRVRPQTLSLVPLFLETFYRQIWTTAAKKGKDRQLRILMRVSDCLFQFGIDIRKCLFASVRNAFGGNLSYVICGGAPLGIDYVKNFRSFGIEILNGYGTTECAPVAAVNRNYFHRDGTVGMAVPDIEIRTAQDGEVLVRGPIVMQGYYKDETATSEVIIDGWYHTGDLGYIDADGFLFLTGRKKNLIILSNGENVSPEELEADFLRDDAVQEVLVYAQENIILAEIYPDTEYVETKLLSGRKALQMNDNEFLQDYFERLKAQVNHNRPIYKQVGKVILRSTEFQKNTSRKILRNGRLKK